MTHQNENDEFIHAWFALMVAMVTRQLPMPLAVTPRTAYGLPMTMHVQVRREHFARWHHVLADVIESTEQHGEETHVHAEGTLRNGTRVHLVTVLPSEISA